MVDFGRSEPRGRLLPRRGARLLERIRERPALPSAGVLRPTSSFTDLAGLWLADLDLRDLSGNTSGDGHVARKTSGGVSQPQPEREDVEGGASST
jgi:hypothetical protein